MNYIDYIIAIGLAWLIETVTWKSNIIPQLHYWGNVALFVVIFLAVYHIGVLRGSASSIKT